MVPLPSLPVGGVYAGGLVVLALGHLVEGRTLAKARRVMFVALLVGAGIVTLGSARSPQIDVFEMQWRGAQLLLAGENPYTVLRVLDTDPAAAHRLVPFTYPPLQLLLVTLSVAITGDPRPVTLLALIAATLLLLLDSDTDVPDDAPAWAVAGTPSVLLMVEAGFVDVVPLGLFVAGVVLVRRGHLSSGAVLFGLCASAKQPMVVLLPLLPLIPSFTREHVVTALCVALLPWLPFFAWDPSGLFESTVRYNLTHAPRADALTLSNLVGWQIPSSLGFVLGAMVAWGAYRSLPRSLGAFVATVALVLALVFLCAWQAFANYWFLCAGLAATAAWCEARGRPA
jgi:hypothetical protein